MMGMNWPHQKHTEIEDTFHGLEKVTVSKLVEHFDVDQAKVETL